MGFASAANTIRAKFMDDVILNIKETTPILSAKTTVSASTTDDSFNDTTEDLSVFDGENTIVVSGFANSGNNGVFTIIAVTEDKITVQENLTTEAVGQSVTIETGVSVQYDNDGAFVQPNNRRWIRFNILDGEAFQRTTGTNARFEYPGVIMIQIFTLADQGDAIARAMADTINTYFRRTRDTVGADKIVFKTPSYDPIGVEGRFWQTNVNIPFYFENTD